MALGHRWLWGSCPTELAGPLRSRRPAWATDGPASCRRPQQAGAAPRHPCHPAPRCAVPCHAVSHRAVLCHAIPRRAVPWLARPRGAAEALSRVRDPEENLHAPLARKPRPPSPPARSRPARPGGHCTSSGAEGPWGEAAWVHPPRAVPRAVPSRSPHPGATKPPGDSASPNLLSQRTLLWAPQRRFLHLLIAPVFPANPERGCQLLLPPGARPSGQLARPRPLPPVVQDAASPEGFVCSAGSWNGPISQGGANGASGFPAEPRLCAHRRARGGSGGGGEALRPLK